MIVAAAHDLTQQRATEEQMARQRDALYQSEKLSTLGALLAGVAHELNNPLSVVVGHAQLMKETAGDPRIVERATKIGNAADRCSRSEEPTSELQSLMRISYAVFCSKKKNQTTPTT